MTSLSEEEKSIVERLPDALAKKTELFRLGKDETGGPCFYWTNPWSGHEEKIANLWWPTHPAEATAAVEALFADLSLHTEADDDATYEIGKRDGYEKAVQDIDVETGGDGEFYGSTIPGRGVDVPTMQTGIVERFEEAAATIQRLERELAEATPDALRYRHLKEHHSYDYPEQYECPQPREFGIQFEWQDSTPARPSMDAVIDREIAAIQEQEAEEASTLLSPTLNDEEVK